MKQTQKEVYHEYYSKVLKNEHVLFRIMQPFSHLLVPSLHDEKIVDLYVKPSLGLAKTILIRNSVQYFGLLKLIDDR